METINTRHDQQSSYWYSSRQTGFENIHPHRGGRFSVPLAGGAFAKLSSALSKKALTLLAEYIQHDQLSAQLFCILCRNSRITCRNAVTFLIAENFSLLNITLQFLVGEDPGHPLRTFTGKPKRQFIFQAVNTFTGAGDAQTSLLNCKYATVTTFQNQ
jgi:hypothetical protein